MVTDSKIALKRFLRNFAHFFSGNGLGTLLGFVTFPILTRALDPASYGLLGLLTAMVSVAVAVSKLGTSEAVIKFGSTLGEHNRRIGDFASSIYILILGSSLIVALLMTGAIPYLTRGITLTDNRNAVFLMIGVVLFRPCSVAMINFLRSFGRSFSFSAISFGTKALAVLLSLIALFRFQDGLNAYCAGLLIAEVISFVGISVYVGRLTHISPGNFNWQTVNQTIRFGLPFMVSELCMHALEYTDRYILAYYQGNVEVAKYAVAGSIPGYVSDILLYAVSYSIVPIYASLFANAGREETEKFLSLAIRIYLSLALLMSASYTILAGDAITILASEKYIDSATPSSTILYGKVLLGLNPLLYAGLYVSQSTAKLTISVVVGLLVNVAVNLALVPTYGILGSAIGISLACLALVLTTAMMAFTHIRPRINWPLLAPYFLAAGAILVLPLILVAHDRWLQLASRAIACLAIMAGVVFVTERNSIRRLLQK